MFSLDPLGQRMQQVGLQKTDLQLWFTSVLRDGIATGTIGAFAPFKEIGTYHLHRMLAEAAVPGDHTQAVQTVLSGFDDATCLSDVEPAFKQLHAKGILISTMTNGSIAITKGLLQRAQLEQYVDLVMDISQPKAWKPSSAAYSYAVKQLKLQPEQVMLVAIHPWDCAGAKEVSGLKSRYKATGMLLVIVKFCMATLLPVGTSYDAGTGNMCAFLQRA
ncbi:hypothetical protein ABBQ32_012393 [Trebouxia sp. C0010 RCD-2024]